MAKKVVIDGVEYVPKESAPVIVGVRQEYEPVHAGPSARVIARYPTETYITIRRYDGEEFDVQIPHRAMIEIMEAIK